jgi:cobalt-zinc-cadmium efflux system outer membrane protein
MKYTILLLLAGISGGCSEYSIYNEPCPGNDKPQTNQCAPANHHERGGRTVDQGSIAEPNGVLTLRDAVRLTLLHNPELKAYAYNIRAAEARHLQTGLWQNPELEIEVENVGGSGYFSGFDSAETTIQLSQIIEPGGKISKRKKVFAYDTQLAEIEYYARRSDISSELTHTFITLLFLQEKLALSEELVQISDAIVSSVEKRVQAGKDSSIDLSRARIGLAKATLQQLDIARYYEATRIHLGTYWNSRTPAFTKAVGRWDELSELPAFEDLQQRLKNHPEMIQRAVEVQQRKAAMALADAGRGGDIKIAGGLKHFNDVDDTAFVFGLSIPLSISDRNQGGRREAAQQLRMAQEMQNASALNVWNQVNQLYANLHTAYTSAMILRDEVMADSEQMFNAAQVSYEQGKIHYLELLDSQKVYFASKNDYLDALADYHFAKTELEQLLGQGLQNINLTVK